MTCNPYIRRALVALAVTLCLLGTATHVEAVCSVIASTSAGAVGAADITSGSIDTSGANFIGWNVAWYGGGDAPTLTDSKGNDASYVGLTAQPGALAKTQLWYMYAPTVGAGHTFTVSGSTGYYSFEVVALNCADVSPFDQQNGAAGAASFTFQPGSVTPGTDNQFILQGLGIDSNATASIDDGYTIIAQVPFAGGDHVGSALAWKQQTTATATNPTWTLDTGVDVEAVAGTFKTTGGGASTSTGGLLLRGVGQ